MNKLAGLLALAAILAGPAAAASAPDVAIVGARIYPAPDAQPIEDGTVVIRDGRIAGVGPRAEISPPDGARIIEARGQVLTAGFWNSHVHLLSPAQLGAATAPAEVLQAELTAMLTRWGFTAVFDIASSTAATLALRRRVEAGEVEGPAILTVGDPFYPQDGTPIYVRAFYQANGLASAEVATPDEAAARAARQLDQGTDGVKLFTGAVVGGKTGVLPMRVDIAKAIVDEAHRRGKVAFTHPANLAGLNVAIDAGVDVLAHTTAMDGGGVPGGWTPELIARMRAIDMALIPTMSLLEVESRRSKGSPEALAQGMAMITDEVRLYAAAGGQILFGTDVGYTDLFDTTREYELMARALDWRQILASLTIAPAARFGFARHKGRIAKGMDADLVLLSADPAQDPAAFAKVRATIRGGRVIWDAAAVSPAPAR